MPSEHKEATTPEKPKRETADAVRRPKVKEAGKRSMQGPEKIGGRMPLNHEYAGQVYSLKGQDSKLHRKYPEGVKFDRAASAEFAPYALKRVEIDMQGNYSSDFSEANKKAGLEETPDGFTWHHNQDGKTMELVPEDLHGAVRHTGGCAVLKAEREGSE